MSHRTDPITARFAPLKTGVSVALLLILSLGGCAVSASTQQPATAATPARTAVGQSAQRPIRALYVTGDGMDFTNNVVAWNNGNGVYGSSSSGSALDYNLFFTNT